MAEVVHTGISGGLATSTLSLFATTKGNLLACMIGQSGGLTKPEKVVDNLGANWTIEETFAETSSTTATWIAWKEAAGGEIEIKVTKGGTTTIQAISYIEISGAKGPAGKIVSALKGASSTELQSPAITTSTPGDVLFLSIAAGSSNLKLKEFKAGEGVTTIGAGSSAKVPGGYIVLTGTVTSHVYTAILEEAKAAGWCIASFHPVATLSGKTSTKFDAKAALTYEEQAVLAGSTGIRFEPKATFSNPATLSGTTGIKFKLNKTRLTVKVTDVYYGPPAEQAEEEARGTEPTPASTRFLDIYPALPITTNAPICVFVHGGGWVQERKSEVLEEVKMLQEFGITVFAPDYREAEVGKGAFPIQVSDIEEAVAFAKANAATYGGNPQDVYLLGESAGGNIVTIAASKLNASKLEIRGVIALSGIYDLREFVEEMETGVYKNPEPAGNASNLIEHTQWALQETLHYTGTGEVPPIVAGKEETNTPTARTHQEAASPTRLSANRRCRYLLYSATEDLIPTHQPEKFKAHLETEGSSVTWNAWVGVAHASGLWNKLEGGISIGRHIINFIKEFPAALEGSGGIKFTASASLKSQSSVNNVELTGVIQSSSALSAKVKSELRLSATATDRSELQGAVRQSIPLSGKASSASSLSISSTYVKLALAGIIVSRTVFSGNLNSGLRVRGTVSSQNTLSGELHVFTPAHIRTILTGAVAVKSNLWAELIVREAGPGRIRNESPGHILTTSPGVIG